jgi:hypothetical protein
MHLLVVWMNVFTVFMVLAMIGLPSLPRLSVRGKRSERLSAQLAGWNTALVFAGALFLALIK